MRFGRAQLLALVVLCVGSETLMVAAGWHLVARVRQRAQVELEMAALHDARRLAAARPTRAADGPARGDRTCCDPRDPLCTN